MQRPGGGENKSYFWTTCNSVQWWLLMRSDKRRGWKVRQETDHKRPYIKKGWLPARVEAVDWRSVGKNNGTNRKNKETSL